MDAGLYIHIPFCLKKCPYCDFYSITDESLQSAFLHALLSEMRMIQGVDLAFDTVYIGGGTPSVLDAKLIRNIMGAARQSFEILPGSEITLEINPGTVTLQQLNEYRRTGVNRINIGVQSFNPVNLRFLGRIHSDRESTLAVKWAQNAGYESIGLDLIYGLPGQTEMSWTMDLKQAVEFEPQHLSCYMLSFEPDTPLYKDLIEKRFKPLAENQICELFETTRIFLAAQGYSQYELSNFSRKTIGISGREDSKANRSRHNRKYWTSAPYIGLGPSAHSFIEPQRFWNHDSVKQYIRELAAGRLPRAQKECLTLEQLMIEAIYLGLRQTEGIFIDAFDKRFGVSFKTMFKKIINDLAEKGLIALSQNHCALTSKGMLYLDTVAALFIEKTDFNPASQ